MRDYDALLRFIAARETVPFRFGFNDCVLFAAGAVKAQTGRNPLSGVGRWGSAKGAQTALQRHGGLEAAVDARMTQTPPSLAQRGDVGLVEFGGRKLLAVVEVVTLCAPGDRGLVRYPRRLMVKAWSADG